MYLGDGVDGVDWGVNVIDLYVALRASVRHAELGSAARLASLLVSM
jgi:hypothetical protein